MTHVVRGHWDRRILELQYVRVCERTPTALESRVDGDNSISRKFLNTLRLLTLVCTTALVSGCITGFILNVNMESSAIQKCSIHSQTSVH